MQSPCTSTNILPPACGNAAASACAVSWQRVRLLAHAHPDRQRVSRRREIVAQHAVQRCERRFTPAPRARHAEQRIERGEQSIEQVADQSDRAADAPIDQPGDAGRARRRRRAENARNAGDVVVHRLDDADHARDGVDRQSTQPTHVGSGCVELLDHGRLYGRRLSGCSILPTAFARRLTLVKAGFCNRATIEAKGVHHAKDLARALPRRHAGGHRPRPVRLHR